MHTHNNQTALITGGSGGIGLELAKLCAHDGYNIILVSRNTEELQKAANSLAVTAPQTVSFIAADLSTSEGVAAVLEYIKTNNISVDALINNAGFGQLAPFADMAPERINAMLQLNITALTMLTRALLPSMLARKSGRIMNVASTAAYQPGPFMTTYYASKAFVLSFSEGLAEELRGTGVSVTALCPGPTKSAFQAEAGLHGSRLLELGLMDAGIVAKDGYKAMHSGRVIVTPGLQNKLQVFLIRLLPRWFVRRLVASLQRPNK
jgi:short-subunit dehydrogenase